MRSQKLHTLKRGRVRSTWNKYNLYNLQRLRLPNIVPRTFFQQKFFAKSVTRSYHGEHIREKQWERMFSRRLNSVVNMRPDYMAKHDGSEQAAGRGSGREERPSVGSKGQAGQAAGAGKNYSNTKMTPYMNMTYAPLENRLDVAVWRALFASSVRQARQMCVHGAVKVNGMKMPYPGYRLNPGDMFQVNVEHVMIATGKQKGQTPSTVKVESEESSEDANEVSEIEAEKDEELEDKKLAKAEKSLEGVDEEMARKREMKELKYLRDRTKLILSQTGGKEISAKQKQAFRALQKQIKVAMSGALKRDPAMLQSASQVDNLSTLLERLELSTKKEESETKVAESKEGAEDEKFAGLTEAERKRFEQLLRNEKENPVDPSKPYLTPWEPRSYMSPFAFIPRYLEVNQKICAAVYLRHPVARQGMAEVPTPFPPELSQLAFTFYLRRR